MKSKFYFLILSFALMSVSLFAQERAKQQQQIDLSKSYIKTNMADWKLSATDIEDIIVENAYQTKHNGVTHVYYQQRYKGIPIFNAILNVNLLPNGKVFHVGNRFHTDIEKAINTTQATLSPEEAILAAAKHLKIQTAPTLSNKSKEEKTIVFDNTKISDAPIKVELLYQPMGNGQLLLAWQLAIKMTTSVDYWNVRVDAQSGEVLEKNNWTRRCSFPNHKHGSGCSYLGKHGSAPATPANNQAPAIMEGESYNVFAIPLESPAEGNRTIVENPADPVASPFGWHDIDGTEGGEFTITRGNNVHAYADPDDMNSSDGTEPNGLDSLTQNILFDFPFDPELEPLGNKDAAVTQLFYMNNVMHDFTYLYGFDETSGNFQENNYANGGRGRDYVEARAIDNINGGDADNASFSSPSDGQNGTMSMFVWNRGGSRVLNIDLPEAISGGLEVSRTNGWGGQIDTNPITGKVVDVDDGSFTPLLGCRTLANPEEIAGKIALIDRGGCNFTLKAELAQEAGAIAAIVCNFENTRVVMGRAPNDGNDITIPVVMLTSGDCQTIRQNIEDIQLTFQVPSNNDEGPNQLDGDFDNGIVAHEYGHGISIRLTGGGTNVSCLFNDEEMGEGWSDFFTLITSVKPGDIGTDPRGIGTYVLRENEDDTGIRSFPYSTDLSIYPRTYKDILSTTAPHPLGEVWAAMLWDLYWAMSDKYGWDPDLYNGTGGNNMAIQLVMDGMKIQSCNPGFVDGRDAILAADVANYDGANQCLIWEVFARRGLGFSADQGTELTRNDIIEGYDIAPSCIQTVKINKTSTPVINAGEEMDISITVSNDKAEAVSNLTITDILPEGANLVSSSASPPPTIQGNTLGFDIASLASGASVTINYTIISDPTKNSISQFKDGGEEGIEFWLVDNLKGTDIWELQDATSNSGDFAWNVPDDENDSDHVLQLDEEITLSGDFPALRFFHKYDVEPGMDAGVVELSINGGDTWIDLAPYFIRNGYTGPIAYTTFAIPNREGFWGQNENFEASYVDLRTFKGERVLVRFRYGSPDPLPNSLNDSYQGWFIDDVEYMDLLAYQSEACVTTSEGDEACAFATDGGTVVEVAQLNTAVDNLEDKGLLFQVFPNPAGDYLNISLVSEQSEASTISLFNMNGQQVVQKSIQLGNTPQTIPFNVADLAGGFYFVEVRTASGVAMKKVILD